MSDGDTKLFREEVKKAWLGIKMLISLGDCSSSEMKQLVKTEAEFYTCLIKPSTEKANAEDVARRRAECDDSEDMQEILRLFWFVVSQYRDPSSNVLSKDGYVQYSLRIQRALIGDDIPESQALELAEAEYLSDVAAYGPMVQEAFSNVMLELLDTWAANAGQFFRSAFAWALFDCIVRHTSYPPRYVDLPHIKLMSGTAEKDLLKKYSKGINARYRMQNWLEFLNNKRFSPQTFDRLTHRKNAVQLPSSMADILAIMGRQAMTDAKLQGAATNRNSNLHDIYKPQEDEKLSLKNTVKSIMLLMPKKKLKVVNENETDDNTSASDSSSVIVPKFPVHNKTKHDIMKNSKGKDVLALTIASKLLYKEEKTRRQSILSAKSISVSAFLHNIRHLVTATEEKNAMDEEAAEEERLQAERMKLVEESGDDFSIEETTTERKPLTRRMSSLSISSIKEGLVIDLQPLQASLSLFSRQNSAASSLSIPGDINFASGDSTQPITDDIDTERPEEDSQSHSHHNHKNKPIVVKDMFSGRRMSKRPTVRIDYRDAWKYQLENDGMSLDSTTDDSSLMSTTGSSLGVGLPVTIKPKSRHGTRLAASTPIGSTSHGISVDGQGEEMGAVDFDFNQFETDDEMGDQSNERRHSCHSVASTISTVSSFSFLKRFQAPDPTSGVPICTTAMEKQYAVKASLKIAADNLTESLGINPVPLFQRPVGHLYHEDGTARRVMSASFRNSHIPFSPEKNSRPRPATSGPLCVSVPRDKSPPRHDSRPASNQENKGKKLKLPPLSPVRVTADKKASPFAASRLRPLSGRALSIMNDSDFDDEHTHRTCDLEDDVDLGRSSENNVFMQEDAVKDTFSWIKDMPRYLKDTGNIKPLTLRAMSKSCRLGNFVVDEPLDLKEF